MLIFQLTVLRIEIIHTFNHYYYLIMQKFILLGVFALGISAISFGQEKVSKVPTSTPEKKKTEQVPAGTKKASDLDRSKQNSSRSGSKTTTKTN